MLISQENEIRAEYLARLKRELAARGARSSMRDFVLFMRPDYAMGWVHEEICELLDCFLADLQARRSPRLLVCMPPRHGKSELLSRLFPAYLLGRDPDMQIIASSYAADLSSRFNRDVQRVIDSDLYRQIFPDTQLNERNVRTNFQGSYIRTSDLFEIPGHAGAYRSAGVGGGITGMGANCLICDDLIKDRASANSATVRNAVWEWFTSTAYTRLAPGGGIVFIGTRWHQDDILGRLLQHDALGDGDHYHVVSYAAIAEHDETHRLAGEALHPTRYDVESLESIRRTIGASDWAALYQQRPVPAGGAIFKLDDFKRWNSANLPPRFEQIIGSWDMTFKDSAHSDFVVGQIWGRRGADCYLLDQVRGRWDFTATLRRFAELSVKWPHAHRWLIEDKANGSAIISTLKSRLSGITPITPKESKEERAQAVAPMIECGNVYIPEATPWLAAFEDEVLNFPAGAHDDQIDAMTQTLNFMRLHRALAVHPNNLMMLRRR